MKKQELLKALQKAYYIYIPVFYKNGEDWKYFPMDKKTTIEEIKNSRDTNYLVEVSPTGLYVWFDIPNMVWKHKTLEQK